MLKQIKKGLYAAGLISIFLLYVMFNKAVADEGPEFLPNTIHPIQVPMMCGESTTVLTQIVNGFKMKSLAAGQVKYAGDLDGDSIGVISFWIHPTLEFGGMLMTIRESNLTCLLGYGVDWQWDTDLMIDVVNEVINEDETSTQ